MHSPKKKPSRGVCQVCGHPVPAIEYEVTGSCTRPGPIVVSGHRFNSSGKLISVRCPDHQHGLQVNLKEINRPASQEELELAAKIRGTR